MSWRIQGLSNSFKKAAGATVSRTIGQLMRITAIGLATHELGEDNLLFFPLMQDFNPLEDQVAELQLTGVANVYVEDATGITGGVPVGPGATGKGIAQAVDGEYVMGFALATPGGNGDMIPVLLAPQAVASSLY